MAYVLSLIAEPRKTPLTADMVAAVAARAGPLRDARWLSPGEAWEAVVETPPADLPQLDVDVNIMPSANRRKRLLVADMDSTVIEQECIDELAEVAGIGDAVREVTARAMRGELEFEAALRARVALLAGQPAAIVAEVIGRRISLAPGARTLVRTMRRAGARTALVSGGFTQFTGHVAAAAGFDEHHANELLIADGRLTGRVAEPILGRDAKLATLGRLCAELGLAAADVIAVGDGANDIPMLAAAGLGVAMHGKPAVQQAVAVRLNRADLTGLLYLQGYARAEFAD